MSSFGSDTPFMLLAKLKVKKDKVAEYLEIADKTDKAIEAEEPGILHHTLIKIQMIPFVLYGQKFIRMMMLYLLIKLIQLLVFILRLMLN